MTPCQFFRTTILFPETSTTLTATSFSMKSPIDTTSTFLSSIIAIPAGRSAVTVTPSWPTRLASIHESTDVDVAGLIEPRKLIRLRRK